MFIFQSVRQQEYAVPRDYIPYVTPSYREVKIGNSPAQVMMARPEPLAVPLATKAGRAVSPVVTAVGPACSQLWFSS